MTARTRPAGRRVWALAPGVLRLREGRLAGGSPFRVVRLSERSAATLAALLGTDAPAPAPVAALTDRLVRYGLLLAPAPAEATDHPHPTGAEVEVELDVTVVVPARSRPEPVAALLDRLPADVPVVLVDDGSSVPLGSALPARTGLRHVRHDTARGPAAARNAGALGATTRWLAFVDADVTPPPGWLVHLLADVDPDVVALGPRVVTGPTAGAAGWVERHAGGVDMGPVPAEVVPGGPVGYLPSAVLVVDRLAFERAGGFDAGWHVAEDVDLVWRLLGEGRVVYRPDVVVGHGARGSLAAVLRRRAFYGTGAAALDGRHPGSVRHADVSVHSLVPWVLAVAGAPVAGAIAAAASVAAAPRSLRTLPAADAARLAAHGHLLAAASLGRWALRPMRPVTLAALLVLRGRRRALAVVVLTGVADVVRRERRGGGPPGEVARAVVARLLDDLAYSLGVWAGVLRARRPGPLLVRVRLRSRG